MFEIRVTERFIGRHALHYPDGRREEPHDHDWRVTLALRTEKLDAAGLAVDFVEVKRRLSEALSPLRGRDLNALPAFATRNPSAEHVAIHLATALSTLAPLGRFAWLEVEEEPGCVARYYL